MTRSTWLAVLGGLLATPGAAPAQFVGGFNMGRFGPRQPFTGLRAPLLCIIDGNPGLRRAVARGWPQAAVQRCGVHKLRNLQSKAPVSAVIQ